MRLSLFSKTVDSNRKYITFPFKPLLPFLILLPIHAAGVEIKPFTTDGCSVFPDGTLNDNSKWLECCIRHDLAYWKGGTFDERKKADDELEQCVADMGEEKISLLMHTGVRFGGSPYFPTWYRWGYGWPMFRGYQTLTEEENQQAQKQLEVFYRLIGQLVEENR